MTLAVLLGNVGVSFALPPCPTDQTQRYHNCFGTYTFGSGNKYVGEHWNDKRHGQGTVTYGNGDEYVGEFRNDKKNGQGTVTYTDGRAQEGIWKDNKFQYAQNVSPTITARKSPTPSKSASDLHYPQLSQNHTYGKEKERLNKEIGEVVKQNQPIPKAVRH